MSRDGVLAGGALGSVVVAAVVRSAERVALVFGVRDEAFQQLQREVGRASCRERV